MFAKGKGRSQMKKHGKRMELAGGIGLFLLAMASDGGSLPLGRLLVLGSLCLGCMLLGWRFTLPRKRRAPACSVSRVCPAKLPAVRPAA